MRSRRSSRASPADSPMAPSPMPARRVETATLTAGLASRFRGIDRSLPVWVGAALALLFLMALPLGWLASLSGSAEGGATLAHHRQGFPRPAPHTAPWDTPVL